MLTYVICDECSSCFGMNFMVVCVSKGVCGNVAPSLFSGDVPEVAISSGEGKNVLQALRPTHSRSPLRTAGWLHPFTLHCIGAAAQHPP